MTLLVTGLWYAFLSSTLQLSLSLQVKCVLGAASSGDTIILCAFGMALELSFCHLCTLRVCRQWVWLPVLHLLLHCAWSNVWVCCWPFASLQYLEWWGERSPLPHYYLQTLHLGCILVFHCLGCSHCNSARVLRKLSILLWCPLLLVYQRVVIKLTSWVNLGIVVQSRNGIRDHVVYPFYIDNFRSKLFQQ